MKLPTPLAFITAACLLTSIAHAADSDLSISSEPKRMEDKASNSTAPKSGDVTKKSQEWGYIVTVENKTFKPMEKLDVKYIIFSKHQELGSKGEPTKKHKTGSATIDKIDTLGTASFKTDSVTLTKAQLLAQPGEFEYFANGGKGKVEDALTGLWVRIYKDGNMIAEYANPSNISTREQWPQNLGGQ